MSLIETPNRQIFSPSAVLRYGGNLFIKVPILLEVDGTPLIETTPNDAISRTTQFAIFNSDGAHLAKIVGTQVSLTPAGEESGLKVTFPSRMIVCTLGSKILFEVRRIAAAQLVINAELYSPSGLLVKADGHVPIAAIAKDGRLMATGSTTGTRIRNTAVGYSVTEAGKTICLGGILVSKP